MQSFLIIGGYLLVSLYTMLQLNHWLTKISRGTGLRVICDLVYVALTALPILGLVINSQPASRILLGLGDIWFGFFVIFTLCMIFFHIIRLINWLIHHGDNQSDETNKTTPWVGFTVISFCVLVALSFNIYGMVTAHKVTTAAYPVSLSKKTTTKGNLKVVLVSDLNLGQNTYEKQMKAMVREINNQQADIVIMAGDTFKGSYKSISNPEKYISILKDIQSKQGVYAVYGNHDVETKLFMGLELNPKDKGKRSPEMERFFNDAGIQVLDDKGIFVNGVQIIGRMDKLNDGTGKSNRRSIASLTAELDLKMPIMVIQHEPGDFKNLAASGVDIVLSGHTHGGQYFPFTMTAPLSYEHFYGLASIHGVYSVVTSGLGFEGPPLRLGSNSEIAVVDISY